MAPKKHRKESRRIRATGLLQWVAICFFDCNFAATHHCHAMPRMLSESRWRMNLVTGLLPGRTLWCHCFKHVVVDLRHSHVMFVIHFNFRNWVGIGQSIFFIINSASDIRSSCSYDDAGICMSHFHMDLMFAASWSSFISKGNNALQSDGRQQWWWWWRLRPGIFITFFACM